MDTTRQNTAPGATPNLRVATLNVWAMQGDWATRRAVLIGGFQVLHPDLIAFHETIKNDEYDMTTGC